MLRELGHELVELSGVDALAAIRHGRDAIVANGLAALVVVGGDGMAGLAANILACSGIPLGLVAAGSGNDAACRLGLPIRDVPAAVRVIDGALRGAPGTEHRRVDLISVRSPSRAEPHMVLGALCAGADAAVNAAANRLRWPRGGARYVRGLLHILPRLRPYGLRITADERTWSQGSVLATLANTGLIGGGMRIAPHADPGDGVLELVVADAVSRMTLLRLFPRVYSGTHIDLPVVSVYHVSRARLAADLDHGAPPPIAFGDGEPIGELPVECDVRPGALTVLAAVTGGPGASGEDA